MQDVPAFKLVFVEQREHLLLPNVTSVKVVQHLYDVLFQYAITEDYEEKLKTFIAKMESHIKTKARTPFSMPLADLVFLEDGLEELRLLNWMQENLVTFEVVMEEPEKLETVLEAMEPYFTFSRIGQTNQILVFPQRITAY